MKTAIIYSSKHGTTGKVAGMIAERLGSDRNITLINLNEEMQHDLSLFDDIILGTSCYAGKPMGKMVRFYKKHISALEQKAIGLFICGMQNEEKLKHQLQKAYPNALHRRAEAEGVMGGEYLLKDLKGIEPYVMKAMKIKEPVHNIDMQAIEEFALKLLIQSKN